MCPEAPLSATIFTVFAAAYPRLSCGFDRESRPVFRAGDAPKDLEMSISVRDHSGVKRVAKREPQIVECGRAALGHGS